MEYFLNALVRVSALCMLPGLLKCLFATRVGALVILGLVGDCTITSWKSLVGGVVFQLFGDLYQHNFSGEGKTVWRAVRPLPRY